MSQENTEISYTIERLDHLGIVAGVIKDWTSLSCDDRLGIYHDETLSAGETVAGMLINGLGFSNKPLSLTPLFFQHCPVTSSLRAVRVYKLKSPPL
jgi:hypothetical protein